MRAIGLMSGTSLDGVDAACLETDGTHIQAFGPTLTTPYTPTLRAALRHLIDLGQSAPPGLVAEAEDELTTIHAEAVQALNTPADIIGFHGQTILHAPHRRLTWQIGRAERLAERTGIPVAFDFRQADVAAGGQGAPLVPIFHAALASGLPRPLLVVNIGGVANITFIGSGSGEAGAALLACDTGPGCALLDDWMAQRTGTPLDRDGRAAAAGTPDEALLTALLAHPFFAQPAPKSLDRQHFAAILAQIAHLSTEDGAATLAALTARAIAALPLPAQPLRVLVAGGGRHNPAIMAALAAATKAPVSPVEAVGWDGDALEAQCFAYLAVRVKLGLPLSFPGTTGVPQPQVGGRVIGR